MAQRSAVRKGGFRIRHRNLRSCLALVPLPWRPVDSPTVCPTCGTTHPVKTYHLNLDSEGTCIVSDTIYTNLRRARVFDTGRADAEFTYEGTVKNPPPIQLGMAPGGRLYRKQDRVHIHIDYGG